MFIHDCPSALRQANRSLNDVISKANLYTHLPHFVKDSNGIPRSESTILSVFTVYD
jgi:hypothetical protein